MNPGTNIGNPAASRLGELLKQVRVPAKTDNEWQKLENGLFVRLDEKTTAGRSSGLSFILPRFSIAWAAAAGLLLFIAGAGITIALLKDNSPTSFASIMSVRGSVSVTWAGRRKPCLPLRTTRPPEKRFRAPSYPFTATAPPLSGSAREALWSFSPVRGSLSKNQTRRSRCAISHRAAFLSK